MYQERKDIHSSLFWLEVLCAVDFIFCGNIDLIQNELEGGWGFYAQPTQVFWV